MAQDLGRPMFDVTSLLNFDFLNDGRDDNKTPQQSIDTLTPQSPLLAEAGDHTEKAPNHDLEVTVTDQLPELIKYGPPDALTKVTHTISPVVMTIIMDSIDHIQAQIAAEEDIRQLKVIEEQVSALEHKLASPLDKGKGKNLAVESGPATIAMPSSAVSDRTDSDTFYTPSEGNTPNIRSPSDAGSEIATGEESLDIVVEVDTARPKAVSTGELLPRRRDLLKAVLRKIGDTDTRRRLFRRSTEALHHAELKAKFKQAKLRLQHAEAETAFVCPASSFS